MRGLRTSSANRPDKFPTSWPRRQPSKLPRRVSTQKGYFHGATRSSSRDGLTRQSGCVAFNSFLLSRFAKGTMSTQSCSPILAWQGVERTSLCCYVDADDSARDRKAGFPEIDIRQIRIDSAIFAISHRTICRRSADLQKLLTQ